MRAMAAAAVALRDQIEQRTLSEAMKRTEVMVTQEMATMASASRPPKTRMAMRNGAETSERMTSWTRRLQSLPKTIWPAFMGVVMRAERVRVRRSSQMQEAVMPGVSRRRRTYWNQAIARAREGAISWSCSSRAEPLMRDETECEIPK